LDFYQEDFLYDGDYGVMDFYVVVQEGLVKIENIEYGNTPALKGT
jgi:hypothetical protein